MSSKLKQQLEVMRLGVENRNKRTYMPSLIVPNGMSNLDHSELEVFLQSDTFVNIDSMWEQDKEMPIMFDNESMQKRLQKIADELKDYAKKEVFIIDSLANMMPKEKEIII